jgi:hypothetical protein
MSIFKYLDFFSHSTRCLVKWHSFLVLHVVKLWPLLLALRLDFSVPLSLLLLQCNSIYEQEIKGLYSYLGSCNLQITFEISGNNYISIPYIVCCKFERNILKVTLKLDVQFDNFTRVMPLLVLQIWEFFGFQTITCERKVRCVVYLFDTSLPWR